MYYDAATQQFLDDTMILWGKRCKRQLGLMAAHMTISVGHALRLGESLMTQLNAGSSIVNDWPPEADIEVRLLPRGPSPAPNLDFLGQAPRVLFALSNADRHPCVPLRAESRHATMWRQHNGCSACTGGGFGRRRRGC